MDTTDGFILSLFRNEKPTLTDEDFNNSEVWVCDLLNDEPELVNKYITHRLNNAVSSDKKLAFLYDCRHCFRCGLNDLKKIKEDPEFGAWGIACCNAYYVDNVDEGIKTYQEYLEKVELAICHWTDCEGLKCGDAPVPNEAKERKPQTENTTARQVLAMYYLAEHLGIWGAVDKANMESFTEFFTGKSHSDIHKKFKSPLDNKESPKEKKKDLKFVKAQFEKLGLRDIVAKINADMP